MFCQSCGAEVKTAARFCKQCGSVIPVLPPPAGQRKLHRWLTLAIGLGAVIAILAGILWKELERPNSTDNLAQSSTSAETALPQLASPPVAPAATGAVDASQVGNAKDQKEVPKPPVYLVSSNSPPEEILAWARQECSRGGISEKAIENSQKAYVRTARLLEQVLRSRPEFSQTDEVLFLLGTCKSRMRESVLEAEEFIREHKAEYPFFEGAGREYDGGDFRQLVARFPRSPLVDDAEYELAVLRHFGECESNWSCYLQRALDRFEPFVRKFPTSPLLNDVIHSINQEGFRYLDALAKDQVGGSGKMAAEYKAQLRRYFELARLLAPTYLSQAGPPIADAYGTLREDQAAKQIYNELLQKLPGSSDAPGWRRKVEDFSQSQNPAPMPANAAVQDLYSKDSLKVLAAARLLASRRDPSLISSVKGWMQQTAGLSEIEKDSSICDLIRWIFEVDRALIYEKIGDWRGGPPCVWTLPDSSLPARILALANTGQELSFAAARWALEGSPEAAVIDHLLHKNQEVQKGAIFVVSYKKYQRAVPQLWRLVESDPGLSEEAGDALQDIDSVSGIAYKILQLLGKTPSPDAVSPAGFMEDAYIAQLERQLRFNPTLGDPTKRTFAKQRIFEWWVANRNRVVSSIPGLPSGIRRELEALRFP